jgi:hypothetical protein
VIWISVASTIAALVAATVAYLGFRENRGDRQAERLKGAIETALQPLVHRITSVEQQNTDAAQRLQDVVEIIIGKALQPIQQQVVVLETKIDVFWKQVAMDAAKILHQPDPRRSEIDRLLELFMEDALDADEELQLRKFLLKIRNYEEGANIGFPVQPGEQTAAAILLRTMNHAITPRHSTAAHFQGDPDAGN